MPLCNVETWNRADRHLATPNIEVLGRGMNTGLQKALILLTQIGTFITFQIKKILHFKRADFQIFCN